MKSSVKAAARYMEYGPEQPAESLGKRAYGDGQQAAIEAAEDDAILMGCIAQGDARAYAALVDRHLDKFLAFAERLTGHRGEAEDILQEAFLRVWKKAPDWNPEGARFTTWFYRIVLNLGIDYRRRKRPEALPEGFDVADGALSTEALLSHSQKQKKVAEALDSLPPRQREAILLCYHEGMSNRQAAEILSVGVKGLESLLVRARRQLAEYLKNEKEYLLKDGWI
jgi:RNA polymerase sigma-70 factor (ECF subfamily)